jgi:hypothetical protein
MSDGSDPDTNPSSIFGYVHDHASEETGVTNYDFDDPEEDGDPEEDDKSNLLWLMGVSLRLMRTATLAVDAVNAALEAYSDTYHNKRPYHTSSLSGIAWVTELLTGHPERIKCELGVRRHVFDVLVNLLRQAGLKDSKYILLEEQLAIFLYASVTGLSTRHIGERFQRSNDTISKYVCYCHFLNTAQSILNTSFKVFQMNSCRLFLPTNIYSLCPTT